jgi:hypothetical protein
MDISHIKAEALPQPIQIGRLEQCAYGIIGDYHTTHIGQHNLHEIHRFATKKIMILFVGFSPNVA